jgi:tagatose-1,6-bisphosphate aldolase
LLEALNRHALQPISDAEFAAFKQAVMRAAMADVSAVLTDPAYGIGVGIAERVLSGRVGLLAPIEVTDYNIHPSQREMALIPNWSVAQIKQVGGDGVKLLLPYHPDAANTQEKHDFVSRIVDQCTQYDIPFYLEPIAYPLDPKGSLGDSELRQITVEMARRFSALGVDVLKLQFPATGGDESVWWAACAEVNAAVQVPWVLLSGGVDYATFARQVQIACEAGASGVIVGRAVWNEAVTLQGAARDHFLATTMRDRLHELASICEGSARPWFDRVRAPDASLNWYDVKRTP